MHFGGHTSPLLSWKGLKPRHTEPNWSPWGLQTQPRSFESPSAEWEGQQPQQTSAALSRWSTLWLHWQRGLNPLWRPASSRESPRCSSSGADTRKHWRLRRVDFKIATDLHLDFALGYCLVQRANAEIALRRFETARKSLKTLTEILLSHQDPYLELENQVLHMRMKLANRRHRFTETLFPEQTWSDASRAVKSNTWASRH